ncbi:MAG: hypothetical protein RL701_5161 [Pseudomonadota bacterium]|jgi:hypothetical protein
MDPINVVVVERDADWTQWNSTSHLIGQALLVLVQQTDETTVAFRARIQERLARVKQSFGSLVLLRGKRTGGLSVDALMTGLEHRAPKEVRTYSHYFRHGFLAAGAPA